MKIKINNIYNKLADHSLVKFILVGIINTLFGYSIYVLFVYLGFIPLFAIIISTVFGIIFNFNSIGRYVFNQLEIGFFKRFVLIYFLLMVNNILFEKFLQIVLKEPYLSGFFSICITACLSYILNKKFVFRI
jgi:putative flippase GtrA